MNGVEILVLGGLIAVNEKNSFQSIGEKLKLSASQVYYAVKSLQKRGLVYKDISENVNRNPLASIKIKKHNCYEFLIHGLKYVFPMEMGAPAIGVQTLSSELIATKEQILSNTVYVWPYGEGNTSGISIKPIHQNIPLLSLQNPLIYRFFVLLDFLRSKNSRDNLLGKEELKRLLKV